MKEEVINNESRKSRLKTANAMTSTKKQLFLSYIIGSTLVATLWFLLSLSLTIFLGQAEDPPPPPGADPWMLKLLWTIVLFPLNSFLPWSWAVNQFGRYGALRFELVEFFANGFIWGAFSVFAYRLLAKTFRGEKN